MTFYRKHHPYDWMKVHILKPETFEVVFGFFIVLIALMLFSYVISFIVYFALEALNIIEADLIQFFGGQGTAP